MMDLEAQLKLQSFLDGELPETQAKEVAAWLAKDQGAVALLTELRQTRQSLSGFESGIRLPESREFYWSKIQREIDRQEAAASRAPAPAPFWAGLRRFLLPATALALVAIAGLIAIRPTGSPNNIETSTTDAGAFTYRDYAGGATLVWLSYPADKEIAQNDPIGTFE